MIFDRGFDETYVCMRFSVRGEDCVAIKAYPYDWQIFAYKEAPHRLKYGQIALQRQRTTAPSATFVAIHQAWIHRVILGGVF